MIRAARHGARRAILTSTAIVVAMIVAVPAHAGGSSMPWEAPLQSILESIEGPVAKIVAVIIIIVTGLSLGRCDRLRPRRARISMRPIAPTVRRSLRARPRIMARFRNSGRRFPVTSAGRSSRRRGRVR